MIFTHDPGTWAGALLTLCVFSFLYRDNPLWKFAEHLFVGLSAGWFVVSAYWSVIHPGLVAPLAAAFGGRAAGGPFAASLGDWRAYLVVPALLGLLLTARLSQRLAWLGRLPLAVVVGTYAGLRMVGCAQGDLVAQLGACLRPLWSATSPWAGAAALVATFGVTTTMLVALRGRAPRGAFGVVTRVGAGFLMVAFGAGFAFAAMSRIAVLIGRVDFLLHDWLRLP